MCKAEDRAMQRALKAYPVKIAERDGYDENLRERKGFVNGYHQAEKDLELTWEDVREMCKQSVLVEIDLGGLVSDERHYTEVLKRFKDLKNERPV